MNDIYNGHYEIGFKMKNRDSYRGTIYNSASRALVTLQDPESLVCRRWYDDANVLPSTGFNAPARQGWKFSYSVVQHDDVSTVQQSDDTLDQ
jgi:hypothetical protein